MPAAQLFSVPSTVRPAGSAAVRISAWPAAGPPTANGVLAVKRRAWRDGRTSCQPVSLPWSTRAISITETPCAACALRTFSADQSASPPGCSRPSSVYSWFITSRPRRLAAALPPAPSGKKCMPSWCMPICTAWSAALFDASGFQAGMAPGMPTGSPQGASTWAV